MRAKAIRNKGSNKKSRRIQGTPWFAKPAPGATGYAGDLSDLQTRMKPLALRKPLVSTDGVVVDDHILFEETVFDETGHVIGRRIIRAEVIAEEFSDTGRRTVYLLVYESTGKTFLAKGVRIKRFEKNVTRHGALRERWNDEVARQRAVARRDHEQTTRRWLGRSRNETEEE